ncbi:MAG: DUF1287 domain-containing protein [Thermoanaerobaculia bacterium]|nr:DUF1287 domain-containing protein [Thermoanaerobaculia bacterium]
MPMLRRALILALLLTAPGIAPAVAPAIAETPGVCLVGAARQQIGVTVIYDPAYLRIPYPDGDIPAERGVCTDVLVRAYRAFGVDLQRLVHEDMGAFWPLYPKLWGLSRPDRNIDHRRVPNLAVFFARHGESFPVGSGPGAYAPGDLVTWRLPSGSPHIGIVSDRRSESGTPLVVHNIGRGTLEEDVLFSFPITGRYRYLPEPLARACGEGTGAQPDP